MNAVLAIAVNEIRIGLRNRWVILASLILLVFALILVLIGSAPTGGTKADGLSVIVASLSTLTVYLVPLIALLLSYDAVAGELERGTLQLTLATQISRAQLLLGKFLGHLLVLMMAVIIGYGVAGLIVLLTNQHTSVDGVINLARLLASSVLLGGTFIAIGYAVSVSTRQTGTAAALALSVWLFAVVLFDLALLGGLLASSDGFFARTIFPYLLLANPADAFRVFNMAGIEVSGGFGSISGQMPIAPALAIFSPFAWMVLALFISTLILKRISP